MNKLNSLSKRQKVIIIAVVTLLATISAIILIILLNSKDNEDTDSSTSSSSSSASSSSQSLNTSNTSSSQSSNVSNTSANSSVNSSATEQVFAKARNLQRKSDIQILSTALLIYYADYESYPSGISTTSLEICKTDASSCLGLVDLSILTNGNAYLDNIPVDPQNTSANGTGYFIMKTSDGKVTISAPKAELNESIIITK